MSALKSILDYQAGNIAWLLDLAEIPNLLWGWKALALIQQDHGVAEIEFVIPAPFAEAAILALEITKYPLCVDPNCHELDQLRYNDSDPDNLCAYRFDTHHPLGFSHFHLYFLECGPVLLTLYRQCDILPWLPALRTGPLPKDDPHIILSSRVTSPFHSDANECNTPHTYSTAAQYPIRILNPNAFTESIIRLLSRDIYANSDLVLLWHIWLITLQDTEGYRKTLPRRFQRAWECYMAKRPGCERECISMTQLGKNLVDNGEWPGSGFAGRETWVCWP
ncbi:hypothetical protein BJX70DRAFT_395166 [Aspergillus crustosus]